MLHIDKPSGMKGEIDYAPILIDIYRRKIINIGLMQNLLKYTGNWIQAFGYFRKESEHP